MKTSRAVLLKRTLIVLMVTILLLIPASVASANVRLPEGETPYYARFAWDEIYHTDEWAVIIFYRAPECIPADFDLLNGFDENLFDPSAVFPCVPSPTTSGFAIWETAPWEGGVAPKQAELKGLGAVPVWFVSWPALQEAMDDGLYIDELRSLLHSDVNENAVGLVGSASYYHETLRPIQAVRVGTLEINASGVLVGDGRTFKVHATSKFWNEGTQSRFNTTVVFK
jgi:hypothetical protein